MEDHFSINPSSKHNFIDVNVVKRLQVTATHMRNTQVEDENVQKRHENFQKTSMLPKFIFGTLLDTKFGTTIGMLDCTKVATRNAH